MSRTADSSAKSVSGGLEEEANGSVDNLPSSEIAVSPRVSTVGTDENVSAKKESQMFVSDAGNHDYSAPGLDSLHWAGVKKRGDFDARSVASSMNAEKDDKSIYEEPAVGAVEEEDQEDDDDDEPEEIVIGSLASSFAGAALSDGPGARHGEEDGGKHGNGNEGRGNVSPRDDIRRITSSQAPSTEADDASIRPAASEDGAGDLEDIALGGGGGVSGEAAPSTTSNPYPAGSSMAPSSAAASPRSPALPHSPISRNSADFDGLREREDGGSPSARKMSLGEDELEDHNERNTSKEEEDNRGNADGITNTTTTTTTNPVPIASSQPYQSSLMRRVTGTAPDGGGGSEDNEGNDEDGDEGTAEYTSSAASMSATASAGASLTGSMPRTETSSVAPSARREDHNEGEHGFNGAEETAAAPQTNTTINNTSNPEMMPVHSNALPTSVAAAATVAAPAAAGPPTTALPAVPGSPHAVIGPPRVHLGTEWEELFKGLLYIDGIDALGRPVVVINADAVPANMRSSALTYVKAHLEPLVSAGHYVIVFTARKAKLPSLWIMGAYQALPRPYRKNVQYVLLVRPTTFLKAVLKFMSPFVSKKAGRKIKVVEDVRELGEATGGEVTLHHLGQAFLEADAAAQEVEMAMAASP